MGKDNKKSLVVNEWSQIGDIFNTKVSKDAIKRLAQEVPRGTIFGDYKVVGKEPTQLEDRQLYYRVKHKNKPHGQWMSVLRVRKLIEKEQDE